MADRLKRLERELGLSAGPAPFALESRTICRRVEKILTAQKKERKRFRMFKLRLVAAATAAIMALGGTALGAGSRIAEMLQNALGPFAPYAQRQEGTVESEGIRVRVLSALTADQTVRVYLEVTDLTGDRLADAGFGGGISLALEGENAYVDSCRLVSYDPESRTALVCLEKNAEVPIPDGAVGEAVLSSIQTGFFRFRGERLPLDRIPTDLLDCQTLPTGETVLVPGQAPLELAEGKGVSVSSLGFAGDGRLHCLTQFPAGAMDDGHAICSAYQKEGDNVLFGTDSHMVRFVQGDTVYCDWSVKASPADRDSLGALVGPYGVYRTGETLKGPWKLPIRVAGAEVAVSPLAGTIDHNTLKELRLSPLGAVVVSSSDDLTMIGGYPLTVFLSDGSRFRALPGIASARREEDNRAAWSFERPVEVKDITGIAVGAWMIPVEQGTAGQGYWLSGVPEVSG